MYPSVIWRVVYYSRLDAAGKNDSPHTDGIIKISAAKQRSKISSTISIALASADNTHLWQLYMMSDVQS